MIPQTPAVIGARINYLIAHGFDPYTDGSWRRGGISLAGFSISYWRDDDWDLWVSCIESKLVVL